MQLSKFEKTAKAILSIFAAYLFFQVLICQKYTTSLLTGGQSPNPFL
jgi:hypothetical protein